jgi:hypothetical protein
MSHAPQRTSGGAAYRGAMPDDAPLPPLPSAEHRPATGDPLCARQVGARYLDARARGLAHEAAVREAAALLWALRPSVPPRQTEAMAKHIAAAVAVS